MNAPPGRRNLLIALARDDGASIPLCVELPGSPATFPDILPAVRAVADALQDDARQAVAALGREVSCRQGCDACCRHLVVLGEAEAAALLRTLRALPGDVRLRVAERFQSGLARLESSGLLPRLLAVHTRRPLDRPGLAEMQAAYWDLALPCPFCEGGACAIYRERPLVCRQHAMTSPPAACRTPFGDQAALEKVLPALDLAGAAAAFDGRLAHPSRMLPLPLCLLREGQLSRLVFPVQEPQQMLARFLDFAAEHYPRKG